MTSVRHLSRSVRAPLALIAILSLTAPSARAQVTYSIDWGGPTIALPDSFGGVPITEGDVLTPLGGFPTLGPLPQPAILITGGPGGLGLPLHPACVGHPPGVPCGVEVDALSYGMDGPAVPGMAPGTHWFSVDEFATSLGAPMVPPDSFTEGAMGALEACADAFLDVAGMPPGPLPPFAAPPIHTAVLDGNGFRSASGFAYPGIGLLEWNPPMLPPDLGDNVDALDADFFLAGAVTYFSLDSAFPDPFTGIPNSASAVLNGPFVGGDVLVTVPGGPPAVYAPALALGLDLVAGPDTDDLDALALFENGFPGYQPSVAPYDWLGGATDMLFFSVRRGSALVGAPDSFFGLPIEEGDLLVPPVAGGLSPFPGIFIAAENLGLATMRSGAPMGFADDLDALDITRLPIMDCNVNGMEDAVDIANGVDPDCNLNGVPDSCDIATGASADINGNLIPDECEFSAVAPYCAAKLNSMGCTPIIGAFGTPSATHWGPFAVGAVNIVSNKNGLLFYGFAPNALPFQGGLLCVQPPVRRTAVQNSGGVFPPNNCTGSYVYDFNARIQGGADPALVVGAAVYSQYWYRDPGDPAGFGTGLTDALSFVIAP